MYSSLHQNAERFARFLPFRQRLSGPFSSAMRVTPWDSFVVVQANALLQRQLENATASLATVIEDLHFLRDQVTTTEVRLIAP
jgi:hypothetical protein